MPRTLAQAAALSGWARRKTTICWGLQLALFIVPPYRPGVPPEKVPPLPFTSLGPGWSVPAGGMNGLTPGVPTGCRVTAAGEEVWVRVSAATVPDTTSATAARIAMTALRENRPRTPLEPALLGLSGTGGRAGPSGAGRPGAAARGPAASLPPGVTGGWGVAGSGGAAGGGSALCSRAPHAAQNRSSAAAWVPQEVQKRAMRCSWSATA